MTQIRCPWAMGNELMQDYHDREWGVPEHDDRRLFEFLVLEGAQAGLNWLTILKKRSGYCRAFDEFDFNRIARYDEGNIASLLEDAGIVRNRLKIVSVVKNARAFLQVRREYGSFDEYLWGICSGAPQKNAWHELTEIPSRTPLSDALSKDLKRRGFSFVGSTICYAFMQAVGVVNDHLVSCFRYDQIGG